MPEYLKKILLSASALCLFALSAPGGPFPLMVLLCLAPLALVVARSSVRDAMLYGFAMGFIGWAVSGWWIYHSLRIWMEFGITASVAVSIVFLCWHAIPYLLFGYACARSGWRPDSLMSCFGGAALLTIILSLYPHILPGHPAHALYARPVLIQVAGLGGTVLLLFLVCLINFLAASVMLQVTRGRAMLPGILCILLILGAMAGYGHYRMHALDQEMRRSTPDRWLTVATVSPNKPPAAPSGDSGSGDGPDYFRQALQQSFDVVASHPSVDVVIWPEAPLGISLRPDSETYRALSHLATEAGRPVIFNAARQIADGAGMYNTVALMESTGIVTHLYLKRILMPFSEYLPFEAHLPFLRTLFPNAGYYKSGADHIVLPVNSASLIPSVCYESLSPRVIRSGVERGGDVIVNMSNNGYFLSEDAARWHLLLTQFRSVEFHLPLVMVTNNGYDALFQADGRIVPSTLTAFQTASETIGTVFIPEKRSLYFTMGRSGRILFYAMLAVMATVMLYRSHVNRRRITTPDIA